MRAASATHRPAKETETGSLRLAPRIPSLAQARRYVRYLGLRRALARAAYVLVNRLVALSVLDCLELRREDLRTSLLLAAESYERRFLDPSEEARLGPELDPVATRIVREAVARGDRCYAVLEGGMPISVGCYSTRPTPVLNDLIVHFEYPDWYMFGGYTADRHRGRRLHGIAGVSAALELFDRGVPALVTVIERTNYASMASALRMGWRPCGTLYRVGTRRPYLGRSPAARTRGMRLSPRGSAVAP